MTKTAAVLLAILLASSPSWAQTPRPMLDYASAATIRDACIAWAGERKLTVAIAVFDSGRFGGVEPFPFCAALGDACGKGERG